MMIHDGDTDSGTPNDTPPTSRPRQTRVYLRQSSPDQVQEVDGRDRNDDTPNSGGTPQ